MTTRVCYYCALAELPSHLDPARKTELRPYGPNGAPICFPCATLPENEAAAQHQLLKQLNAAGGVAVLTKNGPKPVGTEGGYALSITGKAPGEPSDGKVEGDQDKE